MKAEERKALETNTLANTIGNLLQKGKEGVSLKALIVLGVIVLIVVLVFTWRYFAAQSQAKNAELWFKWDQLGDPEDLAAVREKLAKDGDLKDDLALSRRQVEQEVLKKFAADHPGTVQARMARFQLARLTLSDGVTFLGSPSNVYHSRALEYLKQAADTYKKLIDDSRDVPLLYQEALLNCGKANESLGEIADAHAYYERLNKEFPESQFGQEAKKELDRLDDPKTKADVEELAKRLTEKPKSIKPIDHP